MTDDFDAMAEEIATASEDGYFEDDGSVPNCAVPDCEWKRCCWGSASFCHPHEMARVGKAEMDRRYALTHDAADDFAWNGKRVSGERGESA